MTATWVYQDCEKPLTLLTIWATNNKLLQELVEEEKKLKVKEKELKAKEEELRAWAKKLMKAQVEVTQLVGELVRSYALLSRFQH